MSGVGGRLKGPMSGSAETQRQERTGRPPRRPGALARSLALGIAATVLPAAALAQIGFAQAAPTTGNARGGAETLAVTGPTNTVRPEISGTPWPPGSTLTCNPGSWTPTPTSYRYIRESNGMAMPQRTSQTYTTTNNDEDASLT